MPRAREDWTGIQPHSRGWRATVSRGELPRLRKWFPKTTPVSIMQRWRETEHAKFLLNKPKMASGTFKADVEKYLKHPNVIRLTSFKERPTQLAKWTREFGTMRRDQITEKQIREIRDRWATTPRSEMDQRPLSPARVNRLVTTLSNLWTVLDGRSGYNPCLGIAPLTEHEGPVRDIPREDLQALFAALSTRGRPIPGGGVPEGSRTKARILVLATTGLPAATLMKLRPSDVDLKQRIIYRPERRKGRGADRSAQPMTHAAVDAFKEFARLKCWGRFSNSSVLKSFKLAAKKAGITRPLRVYDLRHTFLTELAKASQDEVAVMHIAQHSSIRTTRRYTRGSMSDRAKAAVAAYEASLAPKRPVKALAKRKATKPTVAPDTSRRVH